jgi:hypothetical protein
MLFVRLFLPAVAAGAVFLVKFQAFLNNSGMVTSLETCPTFALQLAARHGRALVKSTLVAEGLHAHLGKGYVYFAMAFSLGVEHGPIRGITEALTRTGPIISSCGLIMAGGHIQYGNFRRVLQTAADLGRL